MTISRTAPISWAETLSLADIALVAYTRFAHEAGIDLGSYPKVRAWVRRIETDLKLSISPEGWNKSGGFSVK